MAVKKKVSVTRVRATTTPGGQYGVISTLGWIGYFIVTAIPIVGLVMCFVWAFDKGNLNRRNFFRATLILMAVGIVLGIIFGLVLVPLYWSLLKPVIDGLGGLM